MKKVAFICFANACRSQIAEGLSKTIGHGLYTAYSAGLMPLGMVYGIVYEAMARRGIDISDQYSKGLEEIELELMDFVITMGCCSGKDFCPQDFKGKIIDWNIPDPFGKDLKEVEKVTSLVERKIKNFIKKEF